MNQLKSGIKMLISYFLNTNLKLTKFKKEKVKTV